MRQREITTWIAVTDGAKARVLAQRPGSTRLELVEERESVEGRTPTRELGTDRPGRSFDRSAMGRHQMQPRADWHTQEKEKFAKEIGRRLDRAGNQGEFDDLIVVAPPRTLGIIRQTFSRNVRGMVRREIGKDLTNLPIHELSKQLGTIRTRRPIKRSV